MRWEVLGTCIQLAWWQHFSAILMFETSSIAKQVTRKIWNMIQQIHILVKMSESVVEKLRTVDWIDQ